MDWRLALGALTVIAFGVAAVWLVRRSRQLGTRPEDVDQVVLERGWQFYPNPTTGEPPGCIYRIDARGRRWLVDHLQLEPVTTREFQGRVHQSAGARMGVIAQLLGVAKLNVRAEKTGSFFYELEQVTKEAVPDKDLDHALAKWLSGFVPRQDNTYFVIAAARLAGAMTLRLESQQVEEFGGEAKLVDEAELGGTFHASETSGLFALEARFDEPMRVVFLAEELSLNRDATAEVAQVERQIMEEPLVWMEQKTTLNFLVEELVSPLGARLGSRWFDAIASEVSEDMRSRLRKLVHDASLPPSRRQVEIAQADLVTYVREHGESAQTQTERIARPEIAVDGVLDRETKQLEQFRAILIFVFDRVARLQRPVALRGFFNSTDCVTVLDARTRSDYVTLAFPEPPSMSTATTSRPQLKLAHNATLAVQEGMPRIWLLRTTPDEADRVAAELNESFTVPKRHLADPEFLERDLPDQPRPEFVRLLEADLLETERPRPGRPPPGLSAEEHVAAMLRMPPDPAKSDPFYTIGPRDGIDLLLGNLKQQVKAQWDAELVWQGRERSPTADGDSANIEQ